MKYHLPVYLHSANYAEEFQETNDYRASFRLNMQCRDAICEAIDAHYKNNRLNEAAAHEVIEQFGYERTMVILANTVHKKDWDGRFSPVGRQSVKAALKDNCAQTASKPKSHKKKEQSL